MFLPEFALAEGRDQAGIFSPFESLLPLQGGPPRGSEQVYCGFILHRHLLPDVKAGESGVRNLALIRATSIFTIMSGGLITMTGYFGIGLSIQVPIIAAQAVVEHIDISSITAMILCKSPRKFPHHHSPNLEQAAKKH